MINLILQYSSVHAHNIDRFSVKIPVEETHKEDVIKTASSQTHTRCLCKPVPQDALRRLLLDLQAPDAVQVTLGRADG